MFSQERGSWQWQEIEAFRQGEDAFDEFLNTSAYPHPAQHRRTATPALFQANPEDFVLPIHVSAGGKVELADGRHRLAIATVSGLESVKVKVVYAPLKHNPVMTSIVRGRGAWKWFFLPFPRPPIASQ